MEAQSGQQQSCGTTNCLGESPARGTTCACVARLDGGGILRTGERRSVRAVRCIGLLCQALAIQALQQQAGRVVVAAARCSSWKRSSEGE